MSKIILGVSGGIAAYKACDVVRLCVKAGHEVFVVMTKAARRFVTPVTFEALSGHHVSTSFFDDADSVIPHIELAHRADLVCIVPATASTLDRLARGSAEDLLSAVVLASRAPLVLAPSMNTVMWEAAPTQTHVKELESRGATVVYPDEGLLACGDVGSGKLAKPEHIFETISQVLAQVSAHQTGEVGTQTPPELQAQDQSQDQTKTFQQDLLGKHVLITAGPTHEAIDPVRYIANASTGKMGFSLAHVAASRGAEVTLVAGPVHLPTPLGVTRVDVVSAQEMHAACFEQLENNRIDIVICCAAVSDYRPAHPAYTKLKKATHYLTKLELIENPDILRDICKASKETSRFVVGFAAETERLIPFAQKKRVDKGAQMIVANDVSKPESSFGADTNRVVLVSANTTRELPILPLDEVSDQIYDAILAELDTHQS